ncbi:MAG TPA: hypothetical protein VFX49_19180 [Chloroflexota bacterium]|nr:hypothetical protein [Chloroflexota bacterium]
MADRVKERVYDPDRLAIIRTLFPTCSSDTGAATQEDVENLDRHLRTLTWIRQHRQDIERWVSPSAMAADG